MNTSIVGSLEDMLIHDAQLQTYADISKQKKEIIVKYSDVAENDSKVAPLVVKEDTNEYVIIIGNEFFMNMFGDDEKVVHAFIQQIYSIPEGAILHVIINLDIKHLSYFIIETGLFISNIIKNAPCTKIFNFGSQITLVDLMIAMCCDEIHVSEFAAISITRADGSAEIQKRLISVYRNVVYGIYKFWAKFGLFTSDEVADLFQSEAENSILLLSDEIKRRLKSSSLKI